MDKKDKQSISEDQKNMSYERALEKKFRDQTEGSQALEMITMRLPSQKSVAEPRNKSWFIIMGPA